jgi:hypothetical protein
MYNCFTLIELILVIGKIFLDHYYLTYNVKKLNQVKLQKHYMFQNDLVVLGIMLK